MRLLKEYLVKERDEMVKNRIRLCAIGRIEDLPPDVQDDPEGNDSKDRAM